MQDFIGSWLPSEITVQDRGHHVPASIDQLLMTLRNRDRNIWNQSCLSCIANHAVIVQKPRILCKTDMPSMMSFAGPFCILSTVSLAQGTVVMFPSIGPLLFVRFDAAASMEPNFFHSLTCKATNDPIAAQKHTGSSGPPQHCLKILVISSVTQTIVVRATLTGLTMNTA